MCSYIVIKDDQMCMIFRGGLGVLYMILRGGLGVRVTMVMCDTDNKF